jgi:hypothetical protein
MEQSMSTPPTWPEDGPLDTQDHALLDELAAVYGATDPPPAGLVDRITFSLTLAGLHAELAELQRAEPLVVRGGDDEETVGSLTFSGSRSSLMVTVTPTEEGLVRVDGWVTGGGTTVELVVGDEHRAEVADAHGRLVWTDVPHGMVRFVIRSDEPDGPATITPRVDL